MLRSKRQILIRGGRVPKNIAEFAKIRCGRLVRLHCAVLEVRTVTQDYEHASIQGTVNVSWE